MDNTLAALEQKYGFELPALYKRLYRDGMLDWLLGSASVNFSWREAVYPRLREKPPMLLYARDFELYPVPEVLAYEAEDEWWGSAYQFVPLGFTGAGDLYAFCPSLTAANGDVPVTRSLHDDVTTTVLAPHLEGFIFREMLDRATSFDHYDLGGYAGFEGFRADLLRAVASISPYLRPAWGELLAEVYNRPLTRQTITLPRRQYTIDALLPAEEAERILRREIGFDKLNTTFEHLPE